MSRDTVAVFNALNDLCKLRSFLRKHTSNNGTPFSFALIIAVLEWAG